jgi:hypothetical protein
VTKCDQHKKIKTVMRKAYLDKSVKFMFTLINLYVTVFVQRPTPMRYTMIFIPSVTEYMQAGFTVKEAFYIKKAVVGFSAAQVLGELEARANDDERYIKLISIITVSIQA